MKTRNSTRRFFNRPLGRSPFLPPPVHVPRWLWVVACAWVLWAAVVSDHSLLRIARLKREIAAADTDSRRIKDETTGIEKQLSDARSRRFRAEEIARTQHGWAAPGEIVYRFRDAHPKADSTR